MKTKLLNFQWVLFFVLLICGGTVGWAAYVIAFKLVSAEAVNLFGITGSAASIVGIAITFYQTVKTTHIVEAARLAAEEASRKVRIDQYRRSLEFARHLMGDIENFVLTRQWHLAGIRAADFSKHTSILAYIRSRPDQQWIEASNGFSTWARIFRGGTTNRTLEFDEVGWSETCTFCQDKINREYEQFE